MANVITSNPEDPGLLQWPGYINNTLTQWQLNGSTGTGSVTQTVNPLGNQFLQNTQDIRQQIELYRLTGTSDTSLFELTTDNPPRLRCLKNGLYSLQSIVGIQCLSQPASMDYSTIRLDICLYDTNGITILQNFQGITPIQNRAAGKPYTISVFGTVPIYVGQTLGLYYIDTTGNTGSYANGVINSNPGDPSAPARAFLTANLLAPLPSLADVEGLVASGASVLTAPTEKIKPQVIIQAIPRGRYNLRKYKK